MEETVKKRIISSKNLAEKSCNLSAKTLLKNDAERVASIQQLQEAIKMQQNQIPALIEERDKFTSENAHYTELLAEDKVNRENASEMRNEIDRVVFEIMEQGKSVDNTIDEIEQSMAWIDKQKTRNDEAYAECLALVLEAEKINNLLKATASKLETKLESSRMKETVELEKHLQSLKLDETEAELLGLPQGADAFGVDFSKTMVDILEHLRNAIGSEQERNQTQTKNSQDKRQRIGKLSGSIEKTISDTTDLEKKISAEEEKCLLALNEDALIAKVNGLKQQLAACEVSSEDVKQSLQEKQSSLEDENRLVEDLTKEESALKVEVLEAVEMAAFEQKEIQEDILYVNEDLGKCDHKRLLMEGRFFELSQQWQTLSCELSAKDEILEARQAELSALESTYNAKLSECNHQTHVADVAELNEKIERLAVDIESAKAKDAELSVIKTELVNQLQEKKNILAEVETKNPGESLQAAKGENQKLRDGVVVSLEKEEGELRLLLERLERYAVAKAGSSSLVTESELLCQNLQAEIDALEATNNSQIQGGNSTINRWQETSDSRSREFDAIQQAIQEKLDATELNNQEILNCKDELLECDTCLENAQRDNEMLRSQLETMEMMRQREDLARMEEMERNRRTEDELRLKQEEARIREELERKQREEEARLRAEMEQRLREEAEKREEMERQLREEARRREEMERQIRKEARIREEKEREDTRMREEDARIREQRERERKLEEARIWEEMQRQRKLEEARIREENERQRKLEEARIREEMERQRKNEEARIREFERKMEEARERERKLEEARIREQRELERKLEEARERERKLEEARVKEETERQRKMEDARIREQKERERMAEEARMREQREEAKRREEQARIKKESEREEARVREDIERNQREKEVRLREERDKKLKLEESRIREDTERNQREEEVRLREEEDLKLEQARIREERERERKLEEARIREEMDRKKSEERERKHQRELEEATIKKENEEKERRLAEVQAEKDRKQAEEDRRLKELQLQEEMRSKRMEEQRLAEEARKAAEVQRRQAEDAARKANEKRHREKEELDRRQREIEKWAEDGRKMDEQLLRENVLRGSKVPEGGKKKEILGRWQQAGKGAKEPSLERELRERAENARMKEELSRMRLKERLAVEERLRLEQERKEEETRKQPADEWSFVDEQSNASTDTVLELRNREAEVRKRQELEATLSASKPKKKFFTSRSSNVVEPDSNTNRDGETTTMTAGVKRFFKSRQSDPKKALNLFSTKTPWGGPKKKAKVGKKTKGGKQDVFEYDESHSPDSMTVD